MKITIESSVPHQKREGGNTQHHSFPSKNAKIADMIVDIPSLRLGQSNLSLPPPMRSLRADLAVHKNTFHNENDGAPVVCGHRGALYKSLENTRHAFITAALCGCEEVELDVFLLKCGTLIVFHGSGSDKNPGWLQEYCNIDGSILDYTYDEVRNFKFNPHYEEFGCGSDHILSLEDECYIPTLEEVLLDAKQTGVTVKIELKGQGTSEPTLELVEKLEVVDQCHYSSFDHSRIKRIRELRPERNEDGSHRYKTGALFDDAPDDFLEMAIEAGASEVHLRYNTCSSEKVVNIHEAGMDSMAWFCGPGHMKKHAKELYYDVANEDPTLYQMLIDTGVRKMCVNKPDLLAQIVTQRKQRV
jgi:glycerophosphoryl diester phosphodiesterase